MPQTFNSGTTIYGGLQTSNFDRPIPPTTSRVQSEPFFGDLGYSIDIPWPDVTTVGYLNGGNMKESGGLVQNYFPTNRLPEQKNLLILSDKPEYFAVNNHVRSTGGIPQINTADPIYAFSRAQHTQII